MSIWNNEGSTERLLELNTGEYTQTQIAEILSEEFGEYVTKKGVQHKLERVQEKLGTLDVNDIETRHLDVVRKLQKVKDIQRLERSDVRILSRYENFFEEFNNSLVEVLVKLNTNITIPKHTISELPVTSILHLSDLHLNEIASVANNAYDIDVANKRLQKLVTKSTVLFLSQGVTKVIIACTGDFITNDKKIDQLTSLAVNRSQAVFLAVSLLKNIILQLSEYFEVVLVGVTGNESRLQFDLGYNDFVASDNYDMTIYNILKYLFQDKITVIVDNPNEVVVEVGGNNILLTHGYNISRINTDKSVSDIYTKYSKLGINLRFVIFGHYHTPYLSSDFSRSGSLIGTNAYALYGLNMSGRASQNVYIIQENGDIDSCIIDLQETAGYTGYDIEIDKRDFKIKTTEKDRTLITYKI